MTIDSAQLQQIIEGAILAAGQPLALKKISTLFETEQGESTVSNDELRAALEAIAENCEGRGFELKELASGWRFQVRQDIAPWVNRLWDERPQKYSRALLETLALVAYRQPITRGDIEDIRGVAVSSHIIRTLVEREWVKVVGHRDVPGRPSLYATTRQFLDYFNLKNLEELPTLGELRDLDELIASMEPQLGLEGGSMADDQNNSGDGQDSSENDSLVSSPADASDSLFAEAGDVDTAADQEAEDLSEAMPDDYLESVMATAADDVGLENTEHSNLSENKNENE